MKLLFFLAILCSSFLQVFAAEDEKENQPPTENCFLSWGSEFRSVLPIASVDLAARFYLSKDVLDSLANYTVRKNALVIIRDFNPYTGDKPHTPKPLSIKVKTIKSGPHKGLVGWHHSLNSYFLDLALPAGYIVENQGDEYSLVKDTLSRNYLGSDIDLQGVFVAGPDGEYFSVDTNLGFYWNSFDLPRHLAKYFRHGANDDYVHDGSQRMLRMPLPMESYYVISPKGFFYSVSDTQQLKQFYDELGLHWKYN